MKALVLEDYNKLVIREVPIPVTARNEVLVGVKACGICGSDIQGMDGSTGRRIPPLIMGHEAAGVVVRTGSEVTRFKEGDRVTFDSTVFPLNDWYTLSGRYNLSDNREVLGVSPGTYKRNGAFAEFVSVPEHVLYKISDHVSFEQAAMSEPLAVAMHAVNRAALATGSCCAVIGTGMIGTLIVQLLKLSGIPEIIAADINNHSLQKAENAGATAIFNTAAENLPEVIFSLTKNRGTDVSFDAAGMEKSLGLAIDVTRKGGKVVLVGNTSRSVGFPLQKVVTNELEILGSCAARGEFETVLNYMEKGMLPVAQHISAVVPLSEGAAWFSKLRNSRGEYGKVILVP